MAGELGDDVRIWQQMRATLEVPATLIDVTLLRLPSEKVFKLSQSKA